MESNVEEVRSNMLVNTVSANRPKVLSQRNTSLSLFTVPPQTSELTWKYEQESGAPSPPASGHLVEPSSAVEPPSEAIRSPVGYLFALIRSNPFKRVSINHRAGDSSRNGSSGDGAAGADDRGGSVWGKF